MGIVAVCNYHLITFSQRKSPQLGLPMLGSASQLNGLYLSNYSPIKKYVCLLMLFYLPKYEIDNQESPTEALGIHLKIGVFLRNHI